MRVDSFIRLVVDELAPFMAGGGRIKFNIPINVRRRMDKNGETEEILATWDIADKGEHKIEFSISIPNQKTQR